MPQPQPRLLPLSAEGVAGLLGVRTDTVYAWIRRSRDWKRVPPFPPAAGKVAQADVWWPDDIEHWARNAGRWPHGDHAAAEVLTPPDPRPEAHEGQNAESNLDQ